MANIRQFLAEQGWYQRLSEEKYALMTRISPTLNTKARWKQVYGTDLNLENPTLFCEKQMYLKLRYYNASPAVKRLAHKVLVRDYVRACGAGETLNELYGVWDSIQDIPFDHLPERFILKTAMGCGNHVLCRDRATLDIQKAKETLRGAWATRSWLLYAELQYRPDARVRQQVLCERLLDTPENRPPEDFKFYCYHGEPLYVLYCFNRRPDGHADFMILDRDWNYLPELTHGRYDTVPEQPACFEKMLETAKKLSGTFPFVRVDLYMEHNAPVFGELTFTPSGGLDLDYTELGQQVLGTPIDIHNVNLFELP